MTVHAKSGSLRRNGLRNALGIAGTLCASVAGVLALVAPNAAVEAASDPVVVGSPPGFRRLNEAQYIRSIEDVFGPGITVPGRFSPPLREEGLMAIGDSHVTVTPSGIEQYELRAREISEQVLQEARRGQTMTCTPASPAAFDEGCARDFLGHYGRLLFRRPLSQAEMASALGLSQQATITSGNFYKGLQVGLSRLLMSPKFIFRVEDSQPDPLNPAQFRLDDYSLATRISFLLWDAPPDAALLDAAARGDLSTEKGLAKQVDRLIASPRFELGVRSFFSDMFGYEQFDGLAKDQSIYPVFNEQLAAAAKEQTLRMIVDLLVTSKGDYRDLFTTRKTFLNRSLGALYRVPVPAEGIEGWAAHTFGPNDKREGVLTLAAFLMLDPTHEGRSSPTIRGKSIRELFLCQPVPQPPPNVNFAAVQDVKNPLFRTARQRLAIHQENPACAGCHALTDPIGLSMENYDAVGAFRMHENDAPIDVTGSFKGTSYTGLIEFSRLLRDSEEVPSCLVQRTYEYGVGRTAGASDGPWLETVVQAFARDKYRFPALVRRIALSDAFRRVSPPSPLVPVGTVAAR